MDKMLYQCVGTIAVLQFAGAVDKFVIKDVLELHQLWIRIPLFILMADYHYAVVQYPLYLVCLLVMTISMCVIPKEAKKMFMEWKEGRKNESNQS